MFHILNIIIIIYLNTLLTFQRQFSSGRSSLLFFVQPFANSRVWVREREIARVCVAVFSMFFYHDCIFIISTGEYCSAKTEEQSKQLNFFFFSLDVDSEGRWRCAFEIWLRRDFFLFFFAETFFFSSWQRLFSVGVGDGVKNHGWCKLSTARLPPRGLDIAERQTTVWLMTRHWHWQNMRHLLRNM